MDDQNPSILLPNPYKTDPKAFLDWFLANMPADWYQALLDEAAQRWQRQFIWKDQYARLHLKTSVEAHQPMWVDASRFTSVFGLPSELFNDPAKLTPVDPEEPAAGGTESDPRS